jgi:uncharacterized protein YrrD
VKVPEPEDEQPLAWKAVLADTPVYSREGDEVGVVVEVLGSEAEDIFHGIVVNRGVGSHEVQIPAATVSLISNKRVTTSMTAQEVSALPVYKPEDSYKLGYVGLLRKHLGWVPDDREGG